MKINPNSSSHHGSAENDLTSIIDNEELLKHLLSELRIGIATSRSAVHRYGLDPVLLWLWCRLAAVAPIQPLAWEFLCAMGEEGRKEGKKRNKEKVLAPVTALKKSLYYVVN